MKMKSELKVRYTNDGSLEERVRREEPFPDNYVFWDDITQKELELYKKVLDKAKTEVEMQKFFEKTPKLLIQHLSCGHGRWCIPHKKLGCELIPDFIIGEKSSIGYEWYGLELKSPNHKLFRTRGPCKGDPSSELMHATNQIIKWRKWLEDNIDYARRNPEENGLGLREIRGDIASYIIMGRRSNIGNDVSDWRKHMKSDFRIEIHTYDWIADIANHRIDHLEDPKNKNLSDWA